MSTTVDSKWLAEQIKLRPETPDGEIDGLKVTHEIVPAYKSHEVVSLRNSLMMGQQATNITFDEDVTIRKLSYEGGVWMTDSPQEVWQMRDALKTIEACRGMYPTVLIGGLGLGVFSALANTIARVETVEKDERVISLVGGRLMGRIIKADIYEFCRVAWLKQFDVAFLDTWQTTGEWCWQTEVVPLRRLIGDKIPKVICWNEEEMIGQIAGPFGSGYKRMLTSLDVTQKDDIAARILRHIAFDSGITDKTYDVTTVLEDILEGEEKLRANPDAEDLVRRLTTDAGSPTWEAEFGGLWDQFQNEYDDQKTSREAII